MVEGFQLSALLPRRGISLVCCMAIFADSVQACLAMLIGMTSAVCLRPAIFKM